MKHILSIFFFLILSFGFYAQENTIKVADNLTTENIPALSSSVINEVKNYTESRSANLISWHPTKKELLISTRFADCNQLHYVKMPGGDRQQWTFFNEPIFSGSFEPLNGNYLLFYKDIGGNEFSQIYRFDLSDKKITLLTNGIRSQNGGVKWSKDGKQIAYTSTKRNGQDRDIYSMNPLDPISDKLIIENTGGGWGISDWSPDDTKLLLREGISVNESRIYEADILTGVKTRVLPLKDERTTYSAIAYSKDGKGIYLTTNSESEFNRLAFYNLITKKLIYITNTIQWDVEEAEISEDGMNLAFTTNENGLSKLYLLSTKTNTYKPVTKVPNGIISGLKWTGNSESLGFTFTNYNANADVFEYNTKSKKIIRWTESELGGMDVSTLQEPHLISWESFDGKMISGYYYKASSKFSGKRPVIINIHGGPEGQFRPTFIARSNYYLNELGISIIYPNVRGSSGYGKTFLDLDNGKNREESVKDIAALFDWIAKQPDLNPDRIMITGGSYGGYMTLAISCLYSDKIRCAIDVVGISNFNTFMKNTEAYRRDLRRVEYGDERDPDMYAFFEAISPANRTNMIKKPLFIVQGGNDPRVPYTESVQMKDKIKANGGMVWFLMANDEGHGFRKKGNIDFQFYATIEFIKQFLLN
jgi:dipeptidyl aminopeptidase/acylaminoacyl peptidase